MVWIRVHALFLIQYIVGEFKLNADLAWRDLGKLLRKVEENARVESNFLQPEVRC